MSTTNRVTGARLKAAALVHSRKQLLSLGVVMGRGKNNVGSVRFTGDQAYAVWSFDPSNGVRTYCINYPSMPDNALVSRREADLISAYTLHEIGHIAYTDNDAVKNAGLKGIRFELWNGVEDARIEHAVIVSGGARGARSSYKKLMSKHTIAIDKGFNPTSINHAPFALALVCRAAYGDGNGYAKRLLNRIPEPKRSLYAKVADGMADLDLDRSGTLGVAALVDEFISGWLLLEPDALTPKQAPQQPQQGQSLPSLDMGESATSEEGQMGQEDPDDQDSNDGDQDDMFDDDGSQGISDDDSSDSQGDGDSDDGFDFSAEDLAQDIADTLEDAQGNSAANALLDSLDVDDEEEEAPSDEKAFDNIEDQLDDEQVIKSDAAVNDVFEAVSTRTKSPVELPRFAPAGRTYMGSWSKMQGLSERTLKSSFKKLHGSSLPALKAQLYRMLKAPECHGWDSGALGGRFEGKLAPRMFCGSERVFKRRWVSEGIDTAVSVVVDMSYSMRGEVMRNAVDLAWTIAEAAESARAVVEVVGFTTDFSNVGNGSGSGQDIHGDFQYSGIGHDGTLVVAKRYQDRCATAAPHFNLMKRLPAGGTPDYSCVRSAAESMSNMPQARKLVIVITDGFGDMAPMLKLTKAAYELYGVDIIGFGVGCNPRLFPMAYSFGAAVDNGNLHTTALKSVNKQLAQRDTRRAA